MADFPVPPEALTTEWLSEELDFPVQGFDVERFEEGIGILGMVLPGNAMSALDEMDAFALLH